MTTHPVDFDTTRFERAHGKSPRGIGSWGFCPAQHYEKNDYLDHVLWYTGSYALAKRSARAYFSNRDDGHMIVVCS